MATRRGPDNSVRVAISGTIDGTNWANVFRAQLTTSSSIAQADLDTWTTAFQNAYKTRFAPLMFGVAQFALAKTVLYSPGGGILNSVVTMTGTGTAAGSVIQDDSACKVVSWSSTVYWRGGKPRTYLTAVPVADIQNNRELTSSAVTALTTAGAGFRTDVNALTSGTITGTSLGFVSFRSANADRVPAVFFPITGARVHKRLGTQRRRLGRWQN